MHFTIKDVMTANPEYVEADTSIGEVAQRMREQDRGFVPIADHGKLVGVLTDRDLAVRAMADGKGSDDKVNSVMSSKVLSCYEEDDVKDALQTMHQNDVQRLIVFNNQKNQDLMGVVSLSDIAEQCGEKDVDMMRRVVHCCRQYH